METPLFSMDPTGKLLKETNPTTGEMKIFGRDVEGTHGFPPDGMEHDVARSCWCEPVEGLVSEQGVFDGGDGVLYFEHRAPA